MTWWVLPEILGDLDEGGDFQRELRKFWSSSAHLPHWRPCLFPILKLFCCSSFLLFQTQLNRVSNFRGNHGILVSFRQNKSMGCSICQFPLQGKKNTKPNTKVAGVQRMKSTSMHTPREKYKSNRNYTEGDLEKCEQMKEEEHCRMETGKKTFHPSFYPGMCRCGSMLRFQATYILNTKHKLVKNKHPGSDERSNASNTLSPTWLQLDKSSIEDKIHGGELFYY